MRRIAQLAVVIATAVALPTLAGAQPAVTTAEPPPRTGWNVGLGLGGGNLSCDGDCDAIVEAGSVTLRAGYMLGPRFAVVGEVWSMVAQDPAPNVTSVTQTIVTGGVQYWVIPVVWLYGGVGAAHARFHYDGLLVDVDSQTDSVPGITVAAGLELLRRRDFVLDVQLRFGTGNYEDSSTQAHNEAIAVGLSWY